MPARPALPADDLYARLEVPVDASFEAIEVAWRALLKRHHPDVAGSDGLERAKRINVAHDWLSDPELRARYDRERHPLRPRLGSEGRRWTAGNGAGPAVARPTRPPPRPVDPRETLRRFLARVGALTVDELDRLSMAEPQAIAFVATIRRFLPPERASAIDDVDRQVRARLPAGRWADLAIRDGVLSAAHEILLADFLDAHLTEPFLGRARERLTRAWDAAVGQPRYGPNTTSVRRLVSRAAALTPDEVVTLLRASGRARLTNDPWPTGLDPAEDEALRVSAGLAARDAAAAVDRVVADLSGTESARVRRLVTRAAHATALRHGFTAVEFDALVAPWRAATGDPGTGRVSGEHRPEPTVRRA
jgi:hypothetical protein